MDLWKMVRLGFLAFMVVTAFLMVGMSVDAVHPSGQTAKLREELQRKWCKRADAPIREAVEYMKTADLQHPTVKTVVMAARLGDFEALKQMQKNGFRRWNDPRILCAAACAPFVDAVEFLVAQGADVNAGDNDGTAPLHGAAHGGHLEVVKFLVSKGADVNAKHGCNAPPLHWAAREGHLEVVKFLVSKGADVNAKDIERKTPLHGAAQWGNLAVVKFLVAKGADVNATAGGETPLHKAAHSGHMEVVKFLVSKGADINTQTSIGTPLHMAAHGGSLPVMQFLLSQGADVNARNFGGRTPLHEAAQGQSVETTKFLVSNGADVNAKDRYGMTPLHIASPFVVDYLRELDNQRKNRVMLITAAVVVGIIILGLLWVRWHRRHHAPRKGEKTDRSNSSAARKDFEREIDGGSPPKRVLHHFMNLITVLCLGIAITTLFHMIMFASGQIEISDRTFYSIYGIFLILGGAANIVLSRIFYEKQKTHLLIVIALELLLVAALIIFVYYLRDLRLTFRLDGSGIPL